MEFFLQNFSYYSHYGWHSMGAVVEYCAIWVSVVVADCQKTTPAWTEQNYPDDEAAYSDAKYRYCALQVPFLFPESIK